MLTMVAEGGYGRAVWKQAGWEISCCGMIGETIIPDLRNKSFTKYLISCQSCTPYIPSVGINKLYSINKNKIKK